MNLAITHLSSPWQYTTKCQLICAFLSWQSEIEGVVLTGDFNAAPIRNLSMLESCGTYEETSGAAAPTFHNFMGIGLWRMDYVFCSKEFKVANAQVVTEAIHGHYPSDHFSIYADLKW